MWSFERSSRAAFAGVMAALLSACGFHLRGQAQLPFETLYIPGANPLAVELKRNVAAASKARLVDSPGEAQAVLGFTQELREKIILSFSAAGRVSEYQLRYRVGFRVSDAKVLAKEAEEALLYRDMQRDMVQQIMRRLVAAKPALPAVE